jgi:hypothetical protein
MFQLSGGYEGRITIIVKEKFAVEEAMKAQRGVLCTYCVLFLTCTLGDCGWSAPRPGRFIPGKETPYTFYTRLGVSQSRSGRVQKISPPPEFGSPTVQSAASRCADYATLVHNSCSGTNSFH